MSKEKHDELLERLRKMEEIKSNGLFSFRTEGGDIVFVLYNFERELCMSTQLSDADLAKHIVTLKKSKSKKKAKAVAKKAAKKVSKRK